MFNLILGKENLTECIIEIHKLIHSLAKLHYVDRTAHEAFTRVNI